MKDNEPWRDGPAIDKPAGVRCPHQKFGVGCAIYAKRPYCCELWTCRWLVNNDTAKLPRPDRAHFVIDVLPDVITARDDASGVEISLQVVQVWCDPNHPNAWRTPEMRDYIQRRAAEGIAILIRYDARNSLIVVAPPISDAWYERAGVGVPGVGLFQ